MPIDYEIKAIDDFIVIDGYRKIMNTSVSTARTHEMGLGRKIIVIPNEEMWDRLSVVSLVGIGDRGTPPQKTDSPDDYRGLKIFLELVLMDGHFPQTLEDWEEIIALQTESHRKYEEEEHIFKNPRTSYHWPV
jgi:hypothetical protein